MTTDKKVKAFVPATNAQISKPFYEKVLGFQFIGEDAYGIEFEMNNTRLRISVVENHQPQQHTILGLNVSDIHSEINALVKNGITFEKYDFLKQDESGIWTAPDGTNVAYFKDPCGNILSIDDKK